MKKSTSALPAYVDDIGHGGICCEAPVVLDNVRMTAFPLLVDAAKLNRFVRSQLNLPGSPYKYLALPVIMHSYLDTDHAVAPGLGYMADRESSFMIPLVQTGPDGEIALRIWAPYLFIDQMSAMATGREVWGYRKSLGDIAIKVPPLPILPLQMGVDTKIFKTFGSNSPCVTAPLLRLSGTPWLSNNSVGGKTLSAALLAFVAGAKDLDRKTRTHLSNLIGQVASESILPAMNLKQFRDVEDSSRACYQALADSPCRVDGYGGFRLLLGWKLQLHILACASHTIASDLGIGTGDSSVDQTVDLPFGFSCSMTFTTLPGRVTWSSTAAPAASRARPARKPRASRTRKPPPRNRRSGK